MNTLEPRLPKKAYLAQLKGCLTSPVAVSDERLTGIVIGSFFSIAYYSSYEWNRRVTQVCSRAWGRAVQTQNGTRILFLRGNGLLSPFWLTVFTLVFAAMISCTPLPELEVLSAVFGELGTIWICAACLSFAACAVTALLSSITEAGEYGAGEITRVLRQPQEFEI